MKFLDLNQNNRYLPYINAIKKYIKTNDKILVVGANHKDILILNYLNYKNTIFSNLILDDINKDINKEDHQLIELFKQSSICKIDGNRIDFNNNYFDFCITNASLHHMSKPHNAICEMFRVAKKGIIFVEGNNSLLSKFLIKLNIIEEYEKSSIDYKNINGGGVDGTTIANYIFRWSEEEIKKILNCFMPNKKKRFIISYHITSNNFSNLKNIKNKVIKRIFNLFLFFFFKIFKRQSNIICAVILKEK
jgi:ubiquinone/menaquinone biosynthesis C-methylase UbiE